MDGRFCLALQREVVCCAFVLRRNSDGDEKRWERATESLRGNLHSGCAAKRLERERTGKHRIIVGYWIESVVWLLMSGLAPSKAASAISVRMCV